MSFLLKWLRAERSPVSLHPTRTVDLDLPFEAAFDRCLDGIERVLGGAIEIAERPCGRIEARFGLIDSERLSCTLEALEEGGKTRVRLEGRRGAQPQRIPSRHVEALARHLISG